MCFSGKNGEFYKEKKNLAGKYLLVFSIAFAAFAVLLFGNVLNYGNSRISFEKGLNGISILAMTFRGDYSVGGYLAEADAFISCEFPAFVAIAVGVVAIVNIAILAVYVAIFFKRKKDEPKFGFAFLGLAATYFIAFIVLISLKTPVDSAGTTVNFYTAYHVKKIFFLLILLNLCAGGIQLALKEEVMKKVRKYRFIYIILVIPTVFMLVFSYYPILLQVVMSFKDYKSAYGIWGSEWVGMRWFKEIFSSREMLGVVFNSVYLSLLTLICTIVPSLFLAILLYDMKKERYRKCVQTIVYLPHFFSWIIIYAIYYAFMSNTGLVNGILKSVTGNPDYYKDFLTDPKIIRSVLMITLIWKEAGWGTILYTAALSNVDASLYEAAEIDGAGPLAKLFNITLPGISSIVIFTIIMSIGSILNNSLDQILMFSNTVVLEKVYTIEMWVYKNGIGKQQFGLASAVGFLQSAIGLVMVLACNKISVKITGRGVW